MKQRAAASVLMFFVLILLTGPALAGVTIKAVRMGDYPDRVRLVVDSDGEIPFKCERLGSYLQLDLPHASFFSGRVPLPSLRGNPVIERLATAMVSDEARLYVHLKFPAYARIYPLDLPHRLVIDLFKDVKEFERSSVVPGMEFLRLARSMEQGPVTASVLRVDPDLFDLSPALAFGIEPEPGLMESISLFFRPVLPWVRERVQHFYKERVSSMARREGAIAAVNGTYFGKLGEPLGVLMINGELISSPIYERTAFIVSDSGKHFIDNVTVNTFFTLPGGIKIEMNDINQRRLSSSDSVLYTSKYGRKTEGSDVVEIVVRSGIVDSVRDGNSDIPPDGYVISLGKNLKNLVEKYVRVGDELDLKAFVIPYSTKSPNSLKHILGGGPRLLKAGRPYVSKTTEKFKRDIAKTRAARTAIGITRDGKLLLVTIDRTSRISDKSGVTPSIGMTLEELSEFLLFLGAYDAMNLDGGGSSTMVLGGRIVNSPANGHEIAVSNGLLIRPKD